MPSKFNNLNLLLMYNFRSVEIWRYGEMEVEKKEKSEAKEDIVDNYSDSLDVPIDVKAPEEDVDEVEAEIKEYESPRSTKTMTPQEKVRLWIPLNEMAQKTISANEDLDLGVVDTDNCLSTVEDDLNEAIKDIEEVLEEENEKQDEIAMVKDMSSESFETVKNANV